jgi:hypothetical protein
MRGAARRGAARRARRRYAAARVSRSLLGGMTDVRRLVYLCDTQPPSAVLCWRPDVRDRTQAAALRGCLRDGRARPARRPQDPGGAVLHPAHHRARRAGAVHLLGLVGRGGLDPLHLHAGRQDHARAHALRGGRLACRCRRTPRGADARREPRPRGRHRRRSRRGGGLPGRACDGRCRQRGDGRARRA